MGFADRLLTIVVTATLTSAVWIVVGTTYVDRDRKQDLWTHAIDSEGATLWQKWFDSQSSEIALELHIGADDSVTVTGARPSADTGWWFRFGP